VFGRARIPKGPEDRPGPLQAKAKGALSAWVILGEPLAAIAGGGTAKAHNRPNHFNILGLGNWGT
jgi:hypothetical protein